MRSLLSTIGAGTVAVLALIGLVDVGSLALEALYREVSKE